MFSLVSVIIPVYNVEMYLRECLDSIIFQTYKELEIILVDDGSSDLSGQICEEYKIKDKRIKLLHKSNGGLSDARNVGLEIANGEFIVFVDSDDVIHPDFVKTLLNEIGNADLIFCNLVKFEDRISFSDVKIKSEKLFDPNALLTKAHTFNSPNVVVAWNKLYRKKLWMDIRYPLGKIHEDEFVIHELLFLCNQVKYIDVDLYGYRQRKGSIMGSNELKSLLDQLEAYTLRKLFMRKIGITNSSALLNSLIIPKIILPSVPINHLAWRNISTSEVLNDRALDLKVKIVFLFKKYIYPLYSCGYFIKKKLLS